jgi:hypothetical protein
MRNTTVNRNQCCGCGMYGISRISDPTTAIREGKKLPKICCPTFILTTNIAKLKINLFLNRHRKNFSQFTKIFYPKNCLENKGLDPGSMGQKGTGPRICNTA